MSFIDADLTNLSNEELESVISKNLLRANTYREEIRKLRNLDDAEVVASSRMQEQEEEPMTTPSFEEDIEYYLYFLSELTEDSTKMDLEKVLPKRSDPNYKNIVRRLKLELLKKEREITLCATTKEELSLFKDDLTTNSHILSLLDSLLAKSNTIQLPSPNRKEENDLIFLLNASGEPVVLEEMKKIDPAYYHSFQSLFMSIKNGSFKNFKRLASNSPSQGLGEVKGFKTRIIVDRLGPHHYAVISAFIKKTDISRGYGEFLTLRSIDYKKQEESLKQNLENKDFLSIQKNYELELFNMLNQDEKSTPKKKVM